MSVRGSFGLSLVQRILCILISFGATMVVSRLLTPSEMGVFVLSTSVLVILWPLAHLSMGPYIVQEQELTPERIGAAAAILLVSGWTMAAAVYLARWPLAAFYGEPGVAGVLAVVALGFLLNPLTTIAVALLQREMRFGAIFVMAVGASVVQAATAVTLAWHGWSYLSLALAFVAEQAAIALAVLCFRPFPKGVRLTFRGWGRLGRVGGAVTGSSLLGEIGGASPILALSRTAGVEAAGFFGRARTVTDLFSRGVLFGLMPVLAPALARAARDGQDLARPVTLAVAGLTALAWPFFAVLALLALPVLRLLFGPQWDASAPILQVLCVLGAGLPITMLVRETLIAASRSAYELRLQAWMQGAQLAAVLLAAPWGLMAVAVTLAVAETARMAVGLAVLRARLGIALGPIAGAMLRSLCVAGASAVGPALLAAGLWRESATLPLVSGLAACGALAAAGWMGALILFRHPVWLEARPMLSGRALRARTP